MRVEEVPQDNENLYGDRYKSVQYAINDKGKYVQVKSVGIEPTNIALKQAWDDVNEDINQALLDVKNGEKSPIYYFMKKEIMDLKILSETTGISKWRIKRHFKPKVFSNIKPSIIDKYVKAFKLSDSKELYNLTKK